MDNNTIEIHVKDKTVEHEYLDTAFVEENLVTFRTRVNLGMDLDLEFKVTRVERLAGMNGSFFTLELVTKINRGRP